MLDREGTVFIVLFLEFVWVCSIGGAVVDGIHLNVITSVLVSAITQCTCEDIVKQILRIMIPD